MINIGRIGFFGGCEEYTGAPYFASLAALKLGADLSYVYCEKDAATVIKSYSPELIVLPYLRLERNYTNNYASLQIKEKILSVVSKQHALSVGSGLGNDPGMLATIRHILEYAKQKKVPIVVDADALSIIGNDPSVISNHSHAILTPNINEFKRLAKSLNISCEASFENSVKECAKRLGGVTLVLKGKDDIISNGETLIKCSETSGLKRCGGQGDILAGAIATFLGWGILYESKKWPNDGSVKYNDLPLVAAYAGCKVTRFASNLGFQKHKLSTQTSDILFSLPEAMNSCFLPHPFSNPERDISHL
ncbi:hypothetical protein BB560_002605 [Smittium megazygosporum]|uniref:ATP-dependent (S)-NAD(P)H-hydrate dehydratase n=1 Tax=Smittium megazygosporum TaxID=133381 RepID=A0A2T9ZEB8_9FUNG|nr:hypothetical protein BB560_002605 [Smittium megazygosporum]